MATHQLHAVLRQLRRIVEPTEPAAISDAELLERFVTQHDGGAFELLLRRHGSMVLNLCRRLLRHEQDAEDAFQATFLTLVRKAGSIGKRGSLSSWLYKVAYRIALAAQATNARAEQLLHALRQRSAACAVFHAPDVDLQPLLDEEVGRLPDKYRAPFLLCYYQGKTNEEAARELGCPKGTVLSRLARARKHLRARLRRRGLVLSATVLSGSTTGRALSATLLEGTVRAGLLVITGRVATNVLSPKVAGLVEGVLRAMLMTKIKIGTVLLLVLGLAGSGVAVIAYRGQAVLGAESPQVQPEVATIQGTAAPVAQPVDRPVAQALDPCLQNARAETRRHLKYIYLALQAYHDTYGHLPAPAIYSKNGKPLLSWRVAILPFLERNDLYRMFHLDEPWDSPHNKLLLGHIPKVYQPAAEQAWSIGVSTLLQVPVGPGAAFERGKTLPFSSFTDGLANTILLTEAATGVEWTRPADIEYDPAKPLPAFGSQMLDDFQALFADGSVYTIRKDVDRTLLRAAITRNGGEPLDIEKLTGPRTAQRRDNPATLLLSKRNQLLKERLAEAQQLLRSCREDLEREKDRSRQDLEATKLQQQNTQLEEEIERLFKQIEDTRAEVARLKAANARRQR